MKQKKSLGQHWLRDPQVLEAITEYAQIKKTDTVLEIGPGLGALTGYLTSQAGHVVAVELDSNLVGKLRGTAPNLHVEEADILKFDLGGLPASYKVAANIPYYLTNNVIRKLAESVNPPSLMVLLVQKEVALRICAQPGKMSVLGVSTQLYYQTQLGIKVTAEAFDPPPKVDSQVVILKRHPKPLFHDIDIGIYFRVVKAGFSAKRKKLISSLSGGLDLSRDQILPMLFAAKIDPNLRAQNLSVDDWYRLYQQYSNLL